MIVRLFQDSPGGTAAAWACVPCSRKASGVFLGIMACGAVLLGSFSNAHATDAAAAQADAARRLYTLAGAFSNEGHTLRDGRWRIQLVPGSARVLEVNLHLGNAHWFCAAAADPAAGLQLALYDEDGRFLPAAAWNGAGMAAAEWTAQYSGPHYLRIARTDTKQDGDPVEAAVLYTYQ